MTKTELIHELAVLVPCGRDTLVVREAAHRRAVEILLAHINDQQVVEAFDRIWKPYRY